VEGGNDPQFTVEFLGMVAGPLGVAGHGLAVDAHQPAGLAHPAALVQVLEDSHGLVVREPRPKERRPLAFREALPALGATQQAAVVLAIVADQDNVAVVTQSIGVTLRIQATKPR
jgi:hypothetical protein